MTAETSPQSPVERLSAADPPPVSEQLSPALYGALSPEEWAAQFSYAGGV